MFKRFSVEYGLFEFHEGGEVHNYGIDTVPTVIYSDDEGATDKGRLSVEARGTLKTISAFLGYANSFIITSLVSCGMLIASTEFQNKLIKEWLYPAPTDRIGDIVRDQSTDLIVFKPAPEAATLPASS